MSSSRGYCFTATHSTMQWTPIASWLLHCIPTWRTVSDRQLDGKVRVGGVGQRSCALSACQKWNNQYMQVRQVRRQRRYASFLAWQSTALHAGGRTTESKSISPAYLASSLLFCESLPSPEYRLVKLCWYSASQNLSHLLSCQQLNKSSNTARIAASSTSLHAYGSQGVSQPFIDTPPPPVYNPQHQPLCGSHMMLPTKRQCSVNANDKQESSRLCILSQPILRMIDSNLCLAPEPGKAGLVNPSQV